MSVVSSQCTCLVVLMEYVSYIARTELFEDLLGSSLMYRVYSLISKAFRSIDCNHINLCVEFMTKRFSRSEAISFRPMNTLNCVGTSISQAQPAIF